MRNITSIRPATYADIQAIYPDLVSVPYSLRAWAIDLNGSCVALAGFIMQPIQPTAFSCVKPDLQVSKRLFVRTALEMLEVMRSTGLPMMAIRDMNYTNSDRFLRFLGFEPAQITKEQEVYKWQQHH